MLINILLQNIAVLHSIHVSEVAKPDEGACILCL